MRCIGLVIVGLLLLLPANVSATDWWDGGTRKDNTATDTRNTLMHFDLQVHDLQAGGGVADVDWYKIWPRLYRSYETVVFNMTSTADPIVLKR